MLRPHSHARTQTSTPIALFAQGSFTWRFGPPFPRPSLRTEFPLNFLTPLSPYAFSPSRSDTLMLVSFRSSCYYRSRPLVPRSRAFGLRLIDYFKVLAFENSYLLIFYYVDKDQNKRRDVSYSSVSFFEKH